jgi:hypothetical protein
MSNSKNPETPWHDKFEKDLNGWKNFNPDRGYGRMPDDKLIQDPPPAMRNDLLMKLQWSLFEPLENIRVREAPDGSPAKLMPFHNHPMAAEPISNTSYDKMSVYIDPVQERMCHDEEDRWERPELLVLDNSLESPITISRFVAAVHEHFNIPENKSGIIECINMFWTGPPTHHGGDLYFVSIDADSTWPPPNKIPHGTRFFFEDLDYDTQPDEGEWRVTVRLFTEGEHGTSVEKFWKQQMECQKRLELERQDYDLGEPQS